MSVLFFLPWVSTSEEIRVGTMRLIPYERGRAPGSLLGFSQDVFDGVLGSYGNQSFFPDTRTSSHVESSTLLIWDGFVDGLELSEEEVGARLEHTTYLAFSALAERRFCTQYGYCNSDSYQAVGQRFEANRPGDTTLITRRRDGHGQHYVGSAQAPRFIRPHHVMDRLLLSFNEGLMQALVALPEGELKQRIDLAIESYLRANTDSPSMTQQSEMVLMRVAFETVLDSTHETPDLRRRFNQHFLSDLPTVPRWSQGSLPESVWRARWTSNVARPLDAWVQDFCCARNAVAHGPRGTTAPPIWQRQNHLLFGSWLFPLVVKQLLASEGHYQLTEEEVVSRAGFEAFFAHDLLAKAEEDGRHFWWNIVERDLLMPVYARRIYANLEGLD